MVNPSDLVNLQVLALQSIPEVVSEMDGDGAAIAAYKDTYPASVNFLEAIQTQPNPSILVVYQGTGPGSNKISWEHRFSYILKTKRSYTDLIAAIVNGIPTGSTIYTGLRLRIMTLHSSCDPIGPMSSDRRQLFVSEYAAIDYWEISFTLAERGVDA